MTLNPHPQRNSRSEYACCQWVQYHPTGRPIRVRGAIGEPSTSCPNAGFRAIPVRSQLRVGLTMHRYLPILVAPHWLKVLMILLALVAERILIASMPTDSSNKAQELGGHIAGGMAICVFIANRLMGALQPSIRREPNRAANGEFEWKSGLIERTASRSQAWS